MSDISLNKPTQRTDFKIAIVCALQVEFDAVCLLVDEFWEDDFGRAEGDLNSYTTGHISNHNVVIILLASMGKTSAARAVANMSTSFTAIQLLLLVGICGGAPSGPRGEILLGDVILGDEVKLYDYGKQYPDGFQRSENFGYSTSNFNRGVRGLLSFLETDHGTQLFEGRISHHLQHLQEAASGHKRAKYAYPGAAEDNLFASEYRHKHHQRAPCICRGCLTDSDPVCEEAIKASCLETDCDTSHIVSRQRVAAKQKLGPERLNEAQRPTVHFGRLASADRVLKSAKERDRLSQELQVIGFEMEAAGFHNELPYIVIKSVCDYADSHKSKTWQPFAAATAASACKSLLERYHQTDPIPKENSGDDGRDREDRAHSTICSIPLVKNEHFVGRQNVLEELKEMLFHKQNFSRAALVGLGGVGKTQVGLQLAYLMKDALRDEGGRECSVLWIPALSIATFEQACADIARHIPRRRGTERDDKQIVKDYFSTKAAGRWFLVLDNADDHDLIFGPSSAPGGLLQHLPQSDLGCVLATTRDRRVAVGFSRTNVVTLSEMDMDEAETFFRESLLNQDFVGADGVVKSLLEFLERTPLAIAQAVAYINVNQVTIQEFVNLLQDVPRDQIGVLSRHFQDSTRYQGSQNAIAKTWLASFDKIIQTDPIAAKLLVFISFIEPKGIPRSLLPEGGSREEFLHAIGTLLGYGFLILHQENFYDMHRLVHIAATVWARQRSTDAMSLNLAMEHIVSVFPNVQYEYRENRRAYLPHALKVLHGNMSSENVHSQNLAWLAGRSLMEEGRIREAVSVLDHLVACTQFRDDEDLGKQLFQHELAAAYNLDGQNKKAISILERVVAIDKKVLGKEHLTTLQSQHALANVYHQDGKTKKAIPMLERVVALQGKALDEEHPDQMASQQVLAVLYADEGQIERAISILEHVVAAGDKEFKDHPNQLAAQYELARLYYQEGRLERAIPILEHVVAIEDKQCKDHPSHLSSQNLLAVLCYQEGQIERAISTLEHVAAVWDKQFKDHPSHLAAQHELATIYRKEGQIERAIPILEHVVTVWDRQSKDHPSHLLAQRELAAAYHQKGQIERAISILEHVVAVGDKEFKDHPNQLAAQHELAMIYHEEGHIERAISILEYVVAVENKDPKEHLNHLASQYELARAYFTNFQGEKAVPLLEHVVSTRRKILREDDVRYVDSEKLLAEVKRSLEEEEAISAIMAMLL